MPESRKPGIAAPASRSERRQKLKEVRKDIDNIRLELRLAEAEERFLRLHLEVFPEDPEDGIDELQTEPEPNDPGPERDG